MAVQKKIWLTAFASVALVAVGGAQIKQVIKVLGVGAAVQRFGGDINRTINRLSGHKDSDLHATRVVPILSGGINSRNAIGAAQIMGTRSDVDRVKAVLQLDQDMFGEIKVRAMIPVETDRVVDNPRRVEGVGISGIVDLRL